ncbi:hypothetical protein CsSME_00002087 [Camellia sinensis var. sinensis]
MWSGFSIVGLSMPSNEKVQVQVQVKAQGIVQDNPRHAMKQPSHNRPQTCLPNSNFRPTFGGSNVVFLFCNFLCKYLSIKGVLGPVLYFFSFCKFFLKSIMTPQI